MNLEEEILDLLDENVDCNMTITKNKGVKVVLTNTETAEEKTRTFKANEVNKIVPWVKQSVSISGIRNLFNCFTAPFARRRPRKK